MELLARGAAALGLPLGAAQLEAYEVYFRELIAWNQRANLTAITDYEEVQQKHFLDSLTVALPLVRRWGAGERLGHRALVDVGTGAGFPGLALKIAFPALRVTLIEATGKKVRFLEHVVATLGVEDVRVVWGRAEELAHQPEHRERYDVATARAVASLASLAELLLPFVRIGGLAIAPKKGDIAAEVDAARHAVAVTGGAVAEIVPVRLPELPDERALVVLAKERPTPPTYPRPAGVPARRPLGLEAGRRSRRGRGAAEAER